jgi:ferredoxin
MTYVITEPCIDVKDTACVDVCPVDCIHPTSDSDDFLRENHNQIFIDPIECIDCGVCEPECPVEAIFIDEDVPEDWEHFTQLNADYFQ